MARAIQLMWTDKIWSWTTIYCDHGLDSALPLYVTEKNARGVESRFCIAGTVAGVPVYKEI